MILVANLVNGWIWKSAASYQLISLYDFIILFQFHQLERDLQQVLDEKEELVTERDVYKTKFDRLNQELNYILKGDENRIMDIDALVMDNKYVVQTLINLRMKSLTTKLLWMSQTCILINVKPLVSINRNLAANWRWLF